ncbi:MAG: YtfJ family protein [Gammaproteobacteria bacterium]|nr:YtfJ family protein [Gammaproteobacteria bacterium]
MLKTLCLGIFLLVSYTVLADGIDLGRPLPELSIADRGELLLQDDEFSFVPWAMPAGIGKIHVLQYMAGTKGAKKLNKPFTDRLQEIPHQNYQVTTVINLDDAMWGTSGFVISEVKKSKRKYPDSRMVLDADGLGREVWKLQSKSSVIVIMDAQGSVRYLKEGAMNEREIEQALGLIRADMKPGAS